MEKVGASWVECIDGQVANRKHKDFVPVEHTLEGDFLLVASWTEQGENIVVVGILVEQGYFVGGVGLVAGDKPNHSDYSYVSAPQLDLSGYTHEVGESFDKLAPQGIECPHSIVVYIVDYV